MKTRLGAILSAAVLLTSATGSLAAEPVDPEEIAKALIVSIRGKSEDGAGIIVAREGRSLYVVTAAHVIDSGVSGVEFDFWRSAVTQVEAVLRAGERDLDVGVVRVRLGPDDLVQRVDRHLDLGRLGVPGALQRNDQVHTIGHPAGRPWFIRRPGPLVESISGGEIVVQDQCLPGSSGGGVFDADWRIVGMMIETGGPFCHALTIDTVRRVVEDDWNLPFGLFAPTGSSLPAAGGGALGGRWRFQAHIVSGRDSSGTILQRDIHYDAFVDLRQAGAAIEGSYSGPPAILCGSGPLEGRVDGNQLRWTLECGGRCDGEEVVFSGTVDASDSDLTVSGTQASERPPSSRKCWLGTTQLRGERE